MALGAQAVVIKGGHTDEDPVVDVLLDERGIVEFAAPRVVTTNTHGTGCTFSAAITAGLANGLELSAAVAAARDYLTRALRAAPGLGHGHGPLQHFPENVPSHVLH
jgi:hydroxymethylpyrimidine/phosphomethylpyrimidine kinase